MAIEVRTRNASGDDNNISILEGGFGSVVLGEVASDFLVLLIAVVGGTYRDILECTHGNGRDVGQVGSDTWGVDDIVEGQFGDQRRCLEQEGQWLERKRCQ